MGARNLPPQVDIKQFTIATQADTINQIAQLEGDLDQLNTVAKDTLVNAINETRAQGISIKRNVLIYAIAMS